MSSYDPSLHWRPQWNRGQVLAFLSLSVEAERWVDVRWWEKECPSFTEIDGAVLCPCKIWSWAWTSSLVWDGSPDSFLAAAIAVVGRGLPPRTVDTLWLGVLLLRLRPLLWWHHSLLLLPVHTWQGFSHNTSEWIMFCFCFVWPCLVACRILVS